MHEADFEEKDFEGPLYNQLLFGSNLIATPGQVFEGHFGLDAALHAGHPLFWDMFGFHDVPPGVILPHFNWGWVWRRLGAVRPLPPFAVNLLVQSKRPDVLKGPNQSLQPFGIRKSYWRFKTKQNQQSLLAKLANTLGNRAFVVYASAAFDTFDALYLHTQNNTIVENSAFVRIDRMQNHHTWNYDVPGMTGVAMSDPEFIREEPILQQLETIASEVESQGPLAELQSLEKLVVTSIYEAEENSFADYVRQTDENRTTYVNELTPRLGDAGKSFFHLVSLFSLLDLEWFVVTPPNRQTTKA